MGYTNYTSADKVGYITLTRPARRNAQNVELLEELDGTWRLAASDGDVRVIVLRAEGSSFSAGHDISQEGVDLYYRAIGDRPGIEGRYEWEHENYLHMSRRWRDIPKPTIAAVQGTCVAAGLALCWPCDLIVASDDAVFVDPTVMMGVPGIEYGAHLWEMGARRAKEFLFTARRVSAAEAIAMGMVNRVVTRDELWPAATALALQITELSPFALALAKRTINKAQDLQGFSSSLESSFDIHQLGHAQNLLTMGRGVQGADPGTMRQRIDPTKG